MTEQEAFANGAKAMQARIVGWLMMKGHREIASQILALVTPPYSEPERWDAKHD